MDRSMLWYSDPEREDYKAKLRTIEDLKDQEEGSADVDEDH